MLSFFLRGVWGGVWGLVRSVSGVFRPALDVPPPSSFIAGRPKAALLFWFFRDFRCGALLFMGFLVIYKYKNSC